MRPCHALKTSQKCFINMKPNRLSPSNRKVWSDINWNVESTIFECNGEMKLNTLKKRRQFYCLYCSSLFGIAKTTGHTPISFINCSSCNIAIPLSRSEFKLFAQNILVMKILAFVISGWSNQQIFTSTSQRGARDVKLLPLLSARSTEELLLVLARKQ